MVFKRFQGRSKSAKKTGLEIRECKGCKTIFTGPVCDKCGQVYKVHRKHNNTPVYACVKPGCPGSYEEHQPRNCGYCGGEDFDFFASTKEFHRWRELEMLQRGKAISKLKRQVALPISINSIRVFKYIADFVYYDDTGKQIIEDSKGEETPLFKLKRKCVRAFYGFDVTLT